MVTLMEFALILMNQVFIMFLLLAVGFFLYRIHFVTAEAVKQMTGIVLHVVTPCLILSTYQMDYDPALARNMLIGFALSALSMLIGGVISQLARIGRTDNLRLERFCILFTNCGFMAIPLIDAVFGELGVFYCNTYLTVFHIVVWTYGIFLMNGRQAAGKKEPLTASRLAASLKPFLTPTMISIAVGLLCYFLPIKFPSPVRTTIDYIASMNTPLAMIVSGMYIAQSDILKALKRPRVYYITLIRCLLVPLAVLGVFLFLPFDDTLLTVLLIVSACPTASLSVLFAASYGKDVNAASNIFTLTTLVSILTIPAVILIRGLLT